MACSIFCFTFEDAVLPYSYFSRIHNHHEDHTLSFLFWAVAQEFTWTSWIMSNIDININTSNFLTPVIYSYHSTSCMAWFGEGTFYSSGSLEPAPVVLFISVFHMHLLLCSHFSVKLLSWFSEILFSWRVCHTSLYDH